MSPLVPYFTVPAIPLDFALRIPGLSQLLDPAAPPSLKPFGVFVAMGGALAVILAAAHAKERGLDPKKIADFNLWVIVGSFVSAHVFDAVLYHPERVTADPGYLIAITDGLSSYGGFLGAALAALAWRAHHRQPIMPYAEVVASVFPAGWALGRAGCAVVHDHPGRLSEAWLAVRFPAPGGGFTGRFDLGLCEMVLTIPLALLFVVLWHRRVERPLGFYVGLMCAFYAPVRFLLDFLRIDDLDDADADPRYAGLTPAQWACFALFGLGMHFFVKAMREQRATKMVLEAG
jgi:phosphatidylglycerol:prolipoprotein diacylglycerol transferase